MFGAVVGMFLGYMVGPEGIKPCLEKIQAVLQLPSPRTIKEVQSLNGKLAGLNKFLSKSVEKSLPLFKTLKKCIKKRLPLDTRSGAGFQTTETAHIRTPHDSIQTPVYFVSRALQGPELNYTPNGKLVLALVFAAKRLRRYFQAHPITVITDQPIKQVMSRPDMAGRLQKWSIMLGEHNITYRPRTSVKGQILADFLVEKPKEASADTSEKEAPQEPWMLFTDGLSCIDGSGAGLILTSPDGAEFTYALRFQFTASNEAKYEALLVELRIAAQMGVSSVQLSVDSKLVVNQVLGTYIAKEENMIKYLEKVLVEYLKEGVLPDDKKEANKLRIKARQYELMNRILYRRSFLRPWLRCVGPLQADYVIREIHEGLCSMHTGPRSVVAKAMRSGYYWLTMHRDTRDMILKGKDCQVHRPVPRNPQQALTPIISPCPFYKWGINIEGLFLEGPGKVKFLIVVMNYFTKWIESKAVTTISGAQSNGLVERANRSLGEGIKARLGEGNKNWIEKIPHVLWAHRKMFKSSNGDTPFSLTYSTKAIIPAKIKIPTYRTAVVDVVHNDDEIRLNLDLLEERRKRAAIREAKAKSKMTRYYNTRVHGVTFKLRDYVYRSYKASHAMDEGKLGPKWEGPYEVTEVLVDGAYKLRSMDRAVLSRTWNIANLKKYYL
ncbi:reverse transcriptase domain-containing protein [Tanacetum coccineum]